MARQLFQLGPALVALMASNAAASQTTDPPQASESQPAGAQTDSAPGSDTAPATAPAPGATQHPASAEEPQVVAGPAAPAQPSPEASVPAPATAPPPVPVPVPGPAAPRQSGTQPQPPPSATTAPPAEEPGPPVAASPAPAEATGQQAPPVVGARAPRPSLASPITLMALGGVAMALGAGFVVGVAQAEERCASDRLVSCDEEAASDFETAGFVLLGVGGATLLGGLIFLSSRLKARKEANAAAAHWRMGLALGPQGMAASVRGSF